MIHCGDALGILRTMPEASIQCCITSPPYWGLRDYGTASWSGGIQDCDHVQRHGLQGKTGQRADRGYTGQIPYKGECGKCGAMRVDQQIGLEETPALFVAKMVEVFAEVRRVLRDDGTLWLNLGDSYNSHPGQRTVHDKVGTKQLTNRGSNETASRKCPDFKAKDLIGIPWRVAIALQADGWWLRSDIIWHKPNPMPESVTDRPTRSHEHIFLLAKSERYYYDYESVLEPAAYLGPNGAQKSPYAQGFGRRSEEEEGGRRLKRSREISKVHGNLPGRSDNGNACNKPDQVARNLRDVWRVQTEPFPEAHFATFPPKLIEPCVIAGCPVGGTILDPFSGAGTTGLVAKKHGRQFVGIELNPDYVAMAEKRLSQEVLQFTEPADPPPPVHAEVSA